MAIFALVFAGVVASRVWAAPVFPQGFVWASTPYMYGREAKVQDGVPPAAGPPRTSLLPFQLWGLAKERMMLAKGVMNGGWMARPNLAAAGMHGLLWDAAQRLEARKPAATPKLTDAAKVAKTISQRGQELVDMSSRLRLGDTQKPPKQAPSLLVPPDAPASGHTLP